MCDYSLHGHPNRLAREGEHLVVATFPGVTKGFVSQCEFEVHSPKLRPGTIRSWNAFVSYLRGLWVAKPSGPMTAVCIPPGARLRLDGIPVRQQADWHAMETENVTFTQLSCREYAHRDAVRFPSGKEVLLQRLRSGQPAVVLSLGEEEEILKVAAQRRWDEEWREALLHR